MCGLRSVVAKHHKVKLTVSLEERCLKRFGHTGDFFFFVTYHSPVYQQGVSVGLRGQLVRLHELLYFNKLTVFIQARITAFEIHFKLGGKRAPLRQKYRRDYGQTCSVGKFVCLRQDVFHAFALNFFTAHRRYGASYSCEKQTHIVVDFGRSSNCRAGISGIDFLLDGYRGRETAYGLALRLAHATKKLTGVSTQTLHIAALPLGIECIEGERRFARTRKSGDNHKAVAGNVNIHFLEIVDSGPAHHDAALPGRNAFCNLFYILYFFHPVIFQTLNLEWVWI